MRKKLLSVFIFVLLGLGYEFISLAHFNPASALYGVSSPSDPRCTPTWGRPDGCYCTPGNSNCLGDCTNSPAGSSTWVCANWPGPACIVQLGQTCGVEGSCCATGQGTCQAVSGMANYKVCTPVCGNGQCDSPQENYLNCSADCPTPTDPPTETVTPTPIIEPTSSVCDATGVQSITTELGNCYQGMGLAGLGTIVCNDGTTIHVTDSGCQNYYYWTKAANSYRCTGHSTCGTSPTSTPTPTSTPVPTATPTPPALACDPNKIGASLNKIDDADFILWQAEFTGATTKASDCNSDNTIDIFDFNKLRDERFLGVSGPGETAN